VVITDLEDVPVESADASNADDDFFSSWDKPAIKRPSAPPSRTATPAGIGRTASPFLNAAANGSAARSKSPSVNTAGTAQPVPAAAIRKTTTLGAGVARKPNILGAKKKPGLGAKKVADLDLDFEEAEKKAKEEAERIEKLGYDPNAEEEKKAPTKFASSTIEIASPTPISPRAGFGATQAQEREVEKVGVGMSRLGFGQVGASAKAAAAPKKMGGFGSTSRTTVGELIDFREHLIPLLIDLIQTMHLRQHARSSAHRKALALTSSLDAPSLTQVHKQKPEADYKDLMGRLQSRRMHTSVDQKRTRLMVNMATWKQRPKTSSDNSALRPETTWRTLHNWLVRVQGSCEVCLVHCYLQQLFANDNIQVLSVLSWPTEGDPYCFSAENDGVVVNEIVMSFPAPDRDPVT